jgi:hypothetical protein
MPPSILIIKNCSVNALKLFYVISYTNPNFEGALIEYDPTSIVNNGVAYSLREYINRTASSKKFLSFLPNPFYYLKEILNNFLNIFITDDVIYKFDDSIIALNDKLKRSTKLLYFLIFLVIVYWILGVFSPIYFTYQDGLLNQESEGRGISWTSHILWAIFMLITFVIETKLYITTLT